jgi:FixJ family two-component response regulator
LSSQQAAPSPSPRIYVVDDDQSVRTAIARLLGENGFEVETFPSAPAFLSRYQAVGAACVIVDQRMPGMSGLDLQGLLAERDGTLSVVFLTAFGDVAASVQAMKGGAIDFLIKPVEEDVLIAAINRGLERSAAALDALRAREDVLTRVARLTPREREVGALVADGLANKVIASKLGTAEQTVKVHRARLMQKLAVGSAAELARLDERTHALRRDKPRTDR